VILRKNSELASKFKYNRFAELRSEQKAYNINYTVFYLGVFFALLFNYLLTLYLGQLLAVAAEFSIRGFDRIGIEVHFVRLLYQTVFDVDLHERYHYPAVWNDWALFRDLIFLLGIIFPLLVLSVKYLTHPILDGPYQHRINALVAPLGLIPMFFFTDWDILFLIVLVTVQNFWVAWRQLDSADDNYSWMQYYSDDFAKKPWREYSSIDQYESLAMMSDPMTQAHLYR